MLPPHDAPTRRGGEDNTVVDVFLALVLVLAAGTLIGVFVMIAALAVIVLRRIGRHP